MDQLKEEHRLVTAQKDKEIRRLREQNDRYRLVIEAMRRNSQQKEELKVNTAIIESGVSAAFTPRE